MKLHSQTVGQGSDIVLLHGWGMHSGIFEFITTKLANEFRVTTIDLPGFGRSSALEDFTLLNIIDRISSVAPEKAIWIGWSLGGLIATKLATLQPESVEKLICVASTPKFVKDQGWPGVEFSVLEDFSKQLAQDYEGTLTRFLLLQFWGSDVENETIRWLKSNLFLHGKPSIDTLNKGLQLLKSTDLREDLKSLQCPILYLLGRLDSLVPAKLADVLPQVKKGTQLTVFRKASHALFLSHENEFLNEVRRFAYD